MAEISKITLPSGNTYDIKDAYARQLIAGGLSFIVAWNGTAAPVVADIPAGVTVTYNGTDYTGTLAAADAEVGSFYLVKSSSQGDDLNKYSEYAVVGRGDDRSWEKMGDTSLDLSSLGDLAYYDSVSLSKGSGQNVLGSDATFTTSVTPTTANIPNVTSAGAASTWAFGLGSGSDAETLIISGANGSAPTLGTAISAVTGISSATTVPSDKDEVKVAVYGDLSVSVS